MPLQERAKARGGLLVLLVAKLEGKHIRKLVEARADHPAAANRLLSLLRILLDRAAEIDLIDANPAQIVKPLKKTLLSSRRTYSDILYNLQRMEMAMSKPMPITEFMKLYPDDDACLDYLFRKNFGVEFGCPRCGKIGKFRKLSKLPAYACQCGEHIHPMAGTPFHRSHTPLQKWFYAIYLFTTTRHGVPAKELQRQLSVNYKTAWRMGHEIRKYLGWVDGDPTLEGHVEIDETMIGGGRCP